MYTQAVYYQRDFILKLNNEYSVDIVEGESKLLFKINSFDIYKVILYKVRWGKTKLFGKIKLNKGGNGYTAQRIRILNSGKLLKRYSYYDIVGLKAERIDTFKVYVIPN